MICCYDKQNVIVAFVAHLVWLNMPYDERSNTNVIPHIHIKRMCVFSGVIYLLSKQGKQNSVSQCHSQYEGYIREILRIDQVFNYRPPCLCLALQGPSFRLVVAAEPIELSLAGQTDAWVTMRPQPCLLVAPQGHSVRFVVALEPIELNLAGQTDMRRGPGTCWFTISV